VEVSARESHYQVCICNTRKCWRRKGWCRTVVVATPVGSDIPDKLESLAEATPDGVSVDDVKVAAVSSEVGLNDIEGKVEEVAKGGSWSLDAFTANDASNYCGDHDECNSGYGEIAFW